MTICPVSIGTIFPTAKMTVFEGFASFSEQLTLTIIARTFVAISFVGILVIWRKLHQVRMTVREIQTKHGIVSLLVMA